MEVKWMIEDFEGRGILDPLIGEIKVQGMKCEIVTYIPFQSGKYDNYLDEDCVIFYGSLNLASQIHRTKPWVPGSICNFKNLCCLTYYSYWGQYLLNKDYIMLPLMELNRRKEDIYKQFGIDGCIFMRPDSGFKCFSGDVYKIEDVDSEINVINNYASKNIDEILVVISSPKKITAEWRCVVVNKKVVASSQYKENGKLDIKEGAEKDVIDLANEVASSEWQPDKAYTLDICKSNGEFYLLEANSFSCSGFYKCNPKPIVTIVSKIALEEWQEYQEP